MNDLQICLIITQEHPDTVDYDHVPLTRGGLEEGESTMAIVEARETQRLTKLTGGLDLLQLNPKDSVQCITGNGQHDGGMGAAQWEGMRNEMRDDRWSTLWRRSVQVGAFSRRWLGRKWY
jgi:hypothetical protein